MLFFSQELVRPSCVIDLNLVKKDLVIRSLGKRVLLAKGKTQSCSSNVTTPVTSKAMNHLVILPNLHQPVELENPIFMVAVILDERRQRQITGVFTIQPTIFGRCQTVQMLKLPSIHVAQPDVPTSSFQWCRFKMAMRR